MSDRLVSYKIMEDPKRRMFKVVGWRLGKPPKICQGWHMSRADLERKLINWLAQTDRWGRAKYPGKIYKNDD